MAKQGKNGQDWRTLDAAWRETMVAMAEVPPNDWQTAEKLCADGEPLMVRKEFKYGGRVYQVGDEILAKPTERTRQIFELGYVGVPEFVAAAALAHRFGQYERDKIVPARHRVQRAETDRARAAADLAAAMAAAQAARDRLARLDEAIAAATAEFAGLVEGIK